MSLTQFGRRVMADISENSHDNTGMDSSGDIKSNNRCPYTKNTEKRHTEGRRGLVKMG